MDAAIASQPWSRPHTDEKGEAMAQLLALLAVAGRPLPIATAREVAAFCLEPSLLLPKLSSRDARTWVRNIGADARTPPSPKAFSCWGGAVVSLRARGRIVEDVDVDTWALGDVEEVEIEGWSVERATFVFSVLGLLSGS